MQQRSAGNAPVRWYLALLGLAMGAVTALNLAGIRLKTSGGSALRAEDVHVTPAFGAAVALVFLAAAVGLGVGISYLVRYGIVLARSPRPRIQPQVLILSFVTYMLSYLALNVVAAGVILLTGIGDHSRAGVAVYLVVQGLTMVGALALGLSVLRVLTAYTGEDPREIGLRPSRLGAVKWGLGGYVAALPMMGVGLMVWAVLSRSLFKHVGSPEHPVSGMVTEGGLVFWLAMGLAVIAAPVVEEIGFRGMLYNALRGTMGVWPAAFVSGALFAIIHPTLPAGFLVILALGVVLALLRETTGSLYASMICHAANNAVALLLVRLHQG